jgi:predicted secreted protein
MARRIAPTLRTCAANAAFAFALALPALASAQMAPPQPLSATLPPQLSLDAAASRDVPQDKVEITLGNEFDGADQAAVSQQLNRLLDTTLAQAKRNTKVTTRSGDYRVWANTDKNGKIIGWHGRAEVILESKDLVAASTLAGDLSSLMAVSNVAFSLSREAREAEEKSLLEEAAQAFKLRAASAANAFGFGAYSIRTLDLSGSGTVFAQPRAFAMRAPTMDAKAASPVPMEAGKATVTVSVHGTVDLLSGR